MLVHSEKLNPCKCGSKKQPDLDSDDMVPSWGVKCTDCGQFQCASNWSMSGAVKAWNDANPIVAKSESKNVCTKESPMPADRVKERWQHPDAVCVDEDYGGVSSGDFEKYECPHCKHKFWVELPN